MVALMKRWNLLLTSFRGERDFLLDELGNYEGEFKASEFRDVVIGYVDDIADFLNKIGEDYISSLSRLIPLDRTFQFEKENFMKNLKKEIDFLTQKVREGDSFAVRCERRGFKNIFSSQQIEEEIGSYIWKQLEKRGVSPKVDLEDPDKLIAIELVGSKAGIAVIKKELRTENDLIRV